MATNERLATRQRIPKLSEQPEGPNGRYYSSYRDANGKCQRQRFSRDRKESEQAYRRWAIKHYDDSVDIVIRDGTGRKDALEQTAIPQQLILISFQDDTKSDMLHACHDNAYPIH